MRLHGLFVGIDLYSDRRIKPLKWCVSDASSFAAGLRDAIADEDCRLVTLFNEAATRPRILQTIVSDLAENAEKDDLVLLYFAGHGTPERIESRQGARFLVPYDTSYENVFGTAISMEKELVDCIERLQCRRVLLILDLCFSGASGGRTFCVPRTLDSAGEKIRLSQLKLGRGRGVLAACRDDEVAEEDDAIEHGVLTHYLLDALSSCDGGAREKTVLSLADTIIRNVKAHTYGRQTPVMSGVFEDMALPCLRRTLPVRQLKP